MPLADTSISEMGKLDTTLLFTVILILPFAIVYLITWSKFNAHQQDCKSRQVPPTIPYTVPYFGSVLAIGLDPIRFVSSIRSQIKTRTAYGIKILGRTIYLIQSPENISQIWRYKTTITSPTYVFFLLRYVFGMDAKAAETYNQDDSGINQTSNPRSKVAAHNRVDYFTHWTFGKYLSGNDHMIKLFNRFEKTFANRLKALGIDEGWSQKTDIFEFWTAPLTASLIEASSGPLLECVNPNFTQDFNEFLPYIHPLIKGLPRWRIPRAYELRESLTRDVLQWQSIARARFHESDIDSDGDADPWWGSQFIRERQKFFSKVDGWDYDAIARSDLGLIWGFALNLPPATIWTIVEVFKNEKLLQRIRKDLAEANFASANSKDDIDRALKLPLLQSIYAEFLRLRVEIYHLFHSKHVSIELKQWNIPQNNLAVIETRAAHRDGKFWNTRNGQYPLDTFWADRFLAYSGDPLSGPIKKDTKASTPSVSLVRDIGEPKFKDSGIAGSFFPYGIGERTCPGRFFAKRAIISFCASIVLLLKKEHYPSSSVFWGTGTQRPVDGIPFKIRKRTSKSV